MSTNVLLAQLRKRREKKVDLGDGKSVTFHRPPESEMAALLFGDGTKERTITVGLDQVRKYVVGWSGFTEADLLGAGVGSSDPVDFSADLWAEVCSDDMGWINQIAEAILKSVVDHWSAKDAVAKNSVPA